MAGHSKWKNNLSRKTAQDKKRAANFQKLSRSITVAVIEGGSPDPNFNPRLRIAVENARSGNMPKDNIERAITKGSGAGEMQFIHLVYELFYLYNSAFIVEITTDNSNRTRGEIIHIIQEHGAKIGVQGSVLPLFHYHGMYVAKRDTKMTEEDILTIAESLEAEDVSITPEKITMIFPPHSFHKAHTQCLSSTMIQKPELQYTPIMPLIFSPDQWKHINTLYEAFESHNDVDVIWVNGYPPESKI